MRKKIYPMVIIAMFAISIVTSVVLAAVLAENAVKEPKFKYVGVKGCRKCHKKTERGEQFKKWQESAHAKAFKTLSSSNPKAVEAARKKGIKGSPQEAKECLKCHVTAYGVDPKWIKVKRKTGKPAIDPADGVQCESCHGPGDGYRKKKMMRRILIERMTSKGISKAAEEKGLIIPTEESCTVCHNDESPTWNPDKYTLKDGKKAGFDFEQAQAKIAHPIPEARKKQTLEEGEEGEDEEDE